MRNRVVMLGAMVGIVVFVFAHDGYARASLCPDSEIRIEPFPLESIAAMCESEDQPLVQFSMFNTGPCDLTVTEMLFDLDAWNELGNALPNLGLYLNDISVVADDGEYMGGLNPTRNGHAVLFDEFTLDAHTSISLAVTTDIDCDDYSPEKPLLSSITASMLTRESIGEEKILVAVWANPRLR